MARQQNLMAAINEGCSAYEQNSFYAQPTQRVDTQSATGNQQVRVSCGRDGEMLRSMKSASAAGAVGDETYEHLHQHHRQHPRHPPPPHHHHHHSHQSQYRRSMPPLIATVNNAKEDINFYGNGFGCEHFLQRSDSMMQEKDERLPSQSSASHQRRHVSHDAILYAAHLSNRAVGAPLRPSACAVDDAGVRRRQCAGEAGRGTIDEDEGGHHLQQLLVSSQPPMNRHHQSQGFCSEMEPVTAMPSDEQSIGDVCLSSHRSYAYPQPLPPSTTYSHIAIEGNVSPMPGHRLRHPDLPGTPSIRATTDRCTSSADCSPRRHEVVGDCHSRELETFAEHFRQRRIRLGATQADVGAALGKLELAGVGCLSQSTICRFESLTLSHSNMVALKLILAAWLMEKERAARERRAVNMEADEMLGCCNRAEDRKRKRTSIAGPEKRSLEAYFAIQQRPSGEKIAQIAEKLELRKDVVRVWFCNQRQKQKRMKVSSANLKIMH